MSDRVAVMRDGKVEQCGEPQPLYEEPATAFVANFLGASNLMPVSVEGGGRLSLGNFFLRADQCELGKGPGLAMVRPENVRLREHGTHGENLVPGMVEDVVYLGFHRELRVRLATGRLHQGRRPERRRVARVRAGRPGRGAHARAAPARAGGRRRGADRRGRRDAHGGRGRRGRGGMTSGRVDADARRRAPPIPRGERRRRRAPGPPRARARRSRRAARPRSRPSGPGRRDRARRPRRRRRSPRRTTRACASTAAPRSGAAPAGAPRAATARPTA